MNKYHQTVVNQIKNAVREADPTATAILYGSRATGKAKKDSDWDILILLDKQSASTRDEQLFRHKLYDIELEIGESISTFVYGIKDWNTRLSQTPIYHEIKQKGIVL